MASSYWVAISVSASVMLLMLTGCFIHYVLNKRKARAVAQGVPAPVRQGQGPRGNVHTLTPSSTVGKPMEFFTSNWYVIFICVFAGLMIIIWISRLMRARKFRACAQTQRVSIPAPAQQYPSPVYAQPVPVQYAQPVPVQYAQAAPVQQYTGHVTVQYAPQSPNSQYTQSVPVQYAQPVSPSMGQPSMMQQAVNMAPSAPSSDPIYRR